jgi:hypothetical protein
MAKGYRDRVIRSHDRLQEIARYIVENAVRAGIVTNSADYAFAHTTISIGTDSVATGL